MIIPTSASRPATSSTAIGPARCSAPTLALGQDRRSASPSAHIDPFAQRFGNALPRGLRLEAGRMTWPAFTAAYAPTAGPLRLEAWAEQRINSSISQYTATIGIDHARRDATIAASGPISAMTAILHETGHPIEVTSFHQQPAGERTATFIHCTDGIRKRWAMGMGDDCTDSILQAFITAANLLHSA